MCFDLINKNHDMAEQLPEAFLVQWNAALAAGKAPTVRRNPYGWYVYQRDAAATADGARRGAALRRERRNNNGSAAPGEASAPPPPDDMPDLSLPAKSKGKIRAIPFKAFDVTKFPRRQYLYGKHYQRGQCTATIGPDGIGKSVLAIGEAVCMATGRDLLGEQPAERCRVWLHNADDDLKEMYRRIAALCQLHGVALSDLEGWLFVTAKDSFDIKMVTGTNGGTTVDRSTIAQIIETIRDNEIDVAIFDPLVAMHSIMENNAGQMHEVVNLFGGIASVFPSLWAIANVIASLLPPDGSTNA
jgi:hypothetical protein